MSERRTALACLIPLLLIGAVFFYGFLLWTGWLSLTRSNLLPSTEFVGLKQ